MSGETTNRLILDAMTLRGIGPYVHGSRLEVRPLTILCGTNGSGKSTWLKALNLLARSHEKGMLPFEFDRDDSGTWHDETNAMVKVEPGAPSLLRDAEAEVRFGPLGTIGLEFVAATDLELSGPAGVTSLRVEPESPARAFLWAGRCKRGTRFRLRLAHPSRHNDEDPPLDDLVELRLDDAFTLRLRRSGDGGRYEVACSEAFLPGRLGDDALVRIAEFSVSSEHAEISVHHVEGSLSAEVQSSLCRNTVERIRELLGLLLSGYFYLGAIRDLHVGGSLGDDPSLSDRIAPDRDVERLKGLAGQDHADEVDRLVARLKELASEHDAIDTRDLTRRRYVGSRGEATHALERAFAYNLMRQAYPPLTGHITQWFNDGEVVGWRVLDQIQLAVGSAEATPQRRIWDSASPELQQEILAYFDGITKEDREGDHDQDANSYSTRLLNQAIARRDFYQPGEWPGLDDEAQFLIGRGIENLQEDEVLRLNRLLIEAIFPGRDGIVKHRTGYLFETYVSFWLEELLDVRINLRDKDQSLSDDWSKRDDPPCGFLVHHETRPQRLKPEWGGTGDDEPENLERLSSPFFRKRGGLHANPAFFSAGFHQVAPMVVQVGLMRRGELMAVENPEVHLHPSLQLEVAGFLLDQSKIGKRILVETHSDLVVRRVLRAIIEEDVAQEAVRIYFAGPGAEVDGYRTSKLEPLEVDDRGRVKNWPTGFMDDDIRESRSLMEATYGHSPVDDEDE